MNDVQMKLAQELASPIEMVMARYIDAIKGPGFWNALDPSKKSLVSLAAADAAVEVAVSPGVSHAISQLID